jgi:tripartite motif-containing protein 71
MRGRRRTRMAGIGPLAIALTLVVVPIATAAPTTAAPTSLPTYVGDFIAPNLGLADMYPVDAASSATDYYILDAGRYRIVRVNRSSGQIVDQVGGHQGKTNTRFAAARSIARDDQTGNIYLADTSNNRVVEYAPDFSFIRAWGVTGSGPGQFTLDYGIAVGPGLNGQGDPAQVAYVTDSTNRVQEFSTSGTTIRDAFGTSHLNKARQLAIDPISQNIYVISAGDKMIDEFTPLGTFVGSFGGFNKTPNILGKFSQDPRGIAIDYINSVGYVFVSDPASSWIQVFTLAGASVGAFGTVCSTPCAPSQFADIRGITITDDHQLLVTDEWGFSLKEFDLSGFDGASSCPTPSHICNVPFDRKLFGGLPPVPGVNSPRGMDVDASGRLFISDWWNQRVERVTPNGNPPQPVSPATWGFRGTQQETGALNFAWDVAVQPGTDWVYVANRESHQIRVFDGDTATAEIAHWGKQGTATGATIAAQFKFPQGVAFAPDGTHLFVVDSGNNRVQEFSIGSNGKPSPIGAVASFGAAGSGAGQFKVPAEDAVALDPASGHTYLWVADTQNNRIQRCQLNTGMTSCSWTAFSTPAGGTKFKLPWGVSVAPDGNVWVADSGNSRVVEMTPDGAQIIQFKGTDVGAGAFDHVFDAEVSNGYLYVSDIWNNRIAAFAL